MEKNFIKFQSEIYENWKKQGFFDAVKNPKNPYSIVLPPPNITGKLHLGHAWDATIQDILIRAKKMQNFDTFFLCGTDHAGIATQIKVEQHLWETKKIKRFQMKIEDFLKESFKWKEDHKGAIHKQWEELGLLVNWKKEVFTLDPHFEKEVKNVFIKMYNDKLIVKENKIIHWDCSLQSAISDIEVVYEEENTNLYFIKYFLEDSSDVFLPIATARPETIFCDVAVIVHPDDKRYLKFHNKNVINPLTNKPIPVLLSKDVELEFGTGAMKLTPAHDFKDFDLNKKFNLQVINCLNKDGTLNNVAMQFEGMDRIQARKPIIDFLEQNNLYIKTESYITRIGKSDRTKTIIEPFYSKQWFVKTKELANKVLLNQDTNNKITFFPSRFENTLKHWLLNIEDWCISRQLWWGHKIPVWYSLNSDEVKVSFEDQDKSKWKQDEDVLDTWFSSALWPFMSFNWPDKEADWNNYFPTNLLVTGYDIIFFWVARMAMQSLYLTNKRPFEKVYIHGLIRDSQNRKMSKSLNNGVNPSDVVAEYGADSLRYFLITNSEAGLDLRYDVSKLKNQASELVSKIEDIGQKLNKAIKASSVNIKTFLVDSIKNYKKDPEDMFLLKFINVYAKSFTKNINEFNFTSLPIYIRQAFYYAFMNNWNIFSSNKYSNEIITPKLAILTWSFLEILKYLHPVMPFVTEDLFKKLTNKESILNEKWEEDSNYEYYKVSNDAVIWYPGFIELCELIKKTNFNNNEFNLNTNVDSKFIVDYLRTHFNLKFSNNAENKINFIVPDSKDLKNVDLENIKHLFILNIENNKNNSSEELLKQQKNILNEIDRCKKMLNNSKFLEKAPKELINQEKAKLKQHEINLNLINSKIKDNHE